METPLTGELPEPKWSYPLTFWELVDALSDSPKTRFLSSTGILLTDEEFSDTYLTPSNNGKSSKFRVFVDDGGVLVIQPEFDIRPIIDGVNENMQKIMWAVQKTTRIRKSIRSAATNPQ